MSDERRAEKQRLDALADKHGAPRPNRYTPSAMGRQLMADDQRRIEIEAVAEALRALLLKQWPDVPFEPTDFIDEADAAIAALDRVRAALGDDEAGRFAHDEICRCGHWACLGTCPRCGFADCRCARCSQGEDMDWQDCARRMAEITAELRGRWSRAEAERSEAEQRAERAEIELARVRDARADDA